MSESGGFGQFNAENNHDSESSDDSEDEDDEGDQETDGYKMNYQSIKQFIKELMFVSFFTN